jgi:heat shock protein HslJ
MRALALALALAGCTTPAATQPAQPAPIHLAGTRWIMENDDAAPHFPTINFEDNRASGYDGCNQWFAGVTQNEESLRFGIVGSTRRACGAGSAAAVERDFLSMLSATRYAHYDQDALVLLDDKQHQIGRFRADR